MNSNKQLIEGIRLFNQGQYFECHEVLEDLWREQQEPERQFTQGIIQAAVGLYHLERSNLLGADKLLNRSIARLSPFEPTFAGIDVTELVRCLRSLLENHEGSCIIVGSAIDN